MTIIPPNTATHATCKKCGTYGERGRAGRNICKDCYGEQNRARVRKWNADNPEYHRQQAKAMGRCQS